MKKKSRGKKKTVARRKTKKAVRRAKRTTGARSKRVASKGSQRPSKVSPRAFKKKEPAIEGTLIGRVSHYFPHVNAAVVVVKKGKLVLGDNLLFKGHTTNFKQTVTSMQMDHVSIQKAKAGDEIGVEVKSRVREHDAVYRLR